MTLTVQQLEMRRTGIGGSDIAAIAGLDPYRTAMDVWRDKLGLVEPFEGNRFTHWGNRLEGVMAEEYAERHGMHLRSSDTLRHPERQWQIGTPDRLAYRSLSHSTPENGVEFKARGLRAGDDWGESGTGQVPDAVAVQAHHYMSLTHLPRWDVAVLIDGNDYREYALKQDPDVEAGLLAIGEKFWRDFVEKKTPPPVDASPAYRDFLLREVLQRPQLKAAPPEADELVARRWDLAEQIKQLEQDKSLVENQLLALVGDAAGMEGPNWRLTISDIPACEIPATTRAAYRKANWPRRRKAA